MLSRRTMLKTTASGFGYLAFASLASQAAEREAAEKNPLAPKEPHFKPKAKRVLFLCMHGAPSHVDTFDYKPRLTQDDGKPSSKARFGGAKLLGSPWKFKQHGQSGQWISDLFPELAKQADEMCIINSMYTDLPNHPQAYQALHTGQTQFSRPSLGAWTLYGLGSRNENLPGFITISPLLRNGGAENYGSSFLPAIYQGTAIGGERQPIATAKIPNLSNPKLSKSAQRLQLDYIQSLNRELLLKDQVNPGVEGVIESYELAFKMQGAIPDVMDLSKETSATKKMYGIDERPTDDFGRQCLLARRFLEAGVRFVEVNYGDWDQHRNLQADLTRHCTTIDKPIHGLLRDLKTRDLLKDTLVIWGGEFGRTPHAQNGDGRDHNNKGFTMWMAGGGVKGGLTHGKTDDYGYEAVEKKVHVHDWHATILHLMGLDHEKLSYTYAGREFKLTDLKGDVVKDVIG
jgi:hypothetical protein